MLYKYNMSATTKKVGKPKKSAGQQRDDRVFKALANRDRRAILDYLQSGPRTTGEICGVLGDLDRCTVMLHLKVLESAELIIVRRQGRLRNNYLNVVPIQRIYERWIQGYAQPAAALLSSLAERMESNELRSG